MSFDYLRESIGTGSRFIPAAAVGGRTERQCPECGDTELHHCVWDGWTCLTCGWEEEPL